MTVKITKDNFETEVLKSETPVLLEFWSPECGPCMMISPIIEDLSSELSGKVKVGKVNINENIELAIKYGAEYIPMFAMFQNGEITNKALGAMSKETLKRKLKL